MNTRLKTVVGLALVVVLSAGLAMAGRGGGGVAMAAAAVAMAAVAAAVDSSGGGGGGGGCQRRGGGGYHAAPSFSTPRQSFNTRVRVSTRRVMPRFRVSAVVFAEFRGQPASIGPAWNCQYAQLGQPP